jgi:serine/threonine protein kinase/cytochrome c-type biogenesis protein CcmH/NrfG
MALAPGTRLGAYEIVGLLGSGGMGDVYRAHDPRLGRDVALKRVSDAFAGDPDRMVRFEREARAVAALSHPNIVTLFALEESGGERYFVMELVDGRRLDEIIEPGGLPAAQALDVAIALADALVTAHSRGIVHRDLKPANVMITRDGRPKVLDFGLARIDDGSAQIESSQALTVQSPVSSAGQVVGTVPYMAPEQVRGEPSDARTDLFALGVVLYEMLTGSRPFGGSTPADVTSSILRDRPTPVVDLRTDLPDELQEVVSRCLEKDRERRYETARAVRADLERIRRGLAAIEPARAERRRRVDPAEVPSIAVLPFANRSHDPEDEYFADGLADELLNVLAKIRGLRVAARTSSASFKGRAVTIEEVGKALNVGAVLEGSVRKSGNRARITVQLIKVADGYHLWSETYDRTLDDIFAVQDEIAQAVVKELRTTLLGGDADSGASDDARAEVAAAARGRGTDPEAHRLYLQGCYFSERMFGPDLERGIALLRQAVARDPHHALAWAQMSIAFLIQGNYGWVEVRKAAEAAREAARHALQLEPDLAEAHAALGRVQMHHDWDWSSAGASLRRALVLAPSSVTALRANGMLANLIGRFDEALELIRRAINLDPLSSNAYFELGHVLRRAGRLDEALSAIAKSLELSPGRISAHGMGGLTLLQAGRATEALAEVQQEPADFARRFGLSVVHAVLGNDGESRAALRELTEHHADDGPFQISGAHSMRGETDEAFAWIDRAFALRDAGLPFARYEFCFRPIHGDPRWPAFLARMGFTEGISSAP